MARPLVVESRSRLSDDEQRIESDYKVQLLDQYLSREILGPGEQVIVTKPGGTLTTHGYRVQAFERDFPDWQPGEEYILFLRLDASSGRYVVPYGAQGAFRNAGGIVEQVSEQGIWTFERDGMPVRMAMPDFAQQLTSLSPR